MRANGRVRAAQHADRQIIPSGPVPDGMNQMSQADMQLSTKGRYAVMAMTDLASREVHGGLVNLADIAARQQLSQSYLEQLFAKLRRAGLVRSARGPGGGYRLAKPASDIAVSEVIAAVNEPIATTRCEGTTGCMMAPNLGVDPERCQTHELWHELSRQITLFLEDVTLADIVQGQVAGRASRLPKVA